MDVNDTNQGILTTLRVHDLPVSRIQQYEANIRTPKTAQLEEFAKALGVPLEYFTDFSLDTYHSVMFALFELEETFNLKVENVNGKHMLCFDDKQLSHYISSWAKEQENSRLSQDTLNAYNEWKIRFPKKMMDETGELIKKARELNN